MRVHTSDNILMTLYTTEQTNRSFISNITEYGCSIFDNNSSFLR